MSSSVRDYTERITTQVIPIELIDNHPSNYNYHPETQLSDLEQSYERRGQFLSKLVWARPDGRYTLVIGEGFTAGAKRGGARVLRCEVLPEDTPPEYVREILLADNLHARNSVPDEDVLAKLLKEQQMMGVSLASLGSDEEHLASLLEAARAGFEDEEHNGYHEDGQGDEAGSLLALLNVTIADPTHTVVAGQVWQLGKHTLLCVHVFKDWIIWNRYLTDETCLFLPFAGPLVPLSRKADSHTLVMVQPDTYIAGHVLDRYAEIHGERSVKLVKQFTVSQELEEDEDDEDEGEKDEGEEDSDE